MQIGIMAFDVIRNNIMYLRIWTDSQRGAFILFMMRNCENNKHKKFYLIKLLNRDGNEYNYAMCLLK
jgi:hypothetical protein